MKDNYEDLLGWSGGKGSKSTGSTGSWSGGGTYEKCYHSHKPLPIDEFFIHGGSCLNPAVKDADIYVGFDMGMSFADKNYPWNEKPVQELFFYIQDMNVPTDPAEFKKLVFWVSGQLKAGKKIHAGCIGGHGRTGMFFAALVTFMTGELDSISYVRKHYCHKAVESSAQVNFLNKHFGITKIESSKKSFTYPPTSASAVKKGGLGSSGSSTPAKPFSGKKSAGKTIDFVNSRMNIWEKPVL